MSGDDLAVVATAASEFEAETKAARLEAEGIEATVIRDAPSGTGQVGVSPTARSASIMVQRDDEERARAVLEQAADESEDVDWNDVDVGKREDDLPLQEVNRMPPLARIAFTVAVGIVIGSVLLGLIAMIL